MWRYTVLQSGHFAMRQQRRIASAAPNPSLNGLDGRHAAQNAEPRVERAQTECWSGSADRRPGWVIRGPDWITWGSATDKPAWLVTSGGCYGSYPSMARLPYVGTPAVS
jgi:hypothetical protein